jgi:hypothetical protein
MEGKGMDMIVEYVKIDKKNSWEPTLMRNGCDYLRTATFIVERTGWIYFF